MLWLGLALLIAYAWLAPNVTLQWMIGVGFGLYVLQSALKDIERRKQAQQAALHGRLEKIERSLAHILYKLDHRN